MEIFGGQGFGLGSGRGFVRWCMDWCSVHALFHGQYWQCMLWTGGVGRVVLREGGGCGWCEVKDIGEQRDDSRLDCAWVAEVGEAVGREDAGEVEVAMSMGEIAEEGETVFETEDGSGEKFVLFEDVGMDADVGHQFELAPVILVVVLVDCATSCDAILGSGGEGEEVDSEVVVCAKKLKGVCVINADFGECVAEDGGIWFSYCQDHAEDVVDVGNVIRGLDFDFFLLR